MSNWQAASRSLVRRLVAEQKMALAAATGIFVVIGLIALLTDTYEIALLCILLLQAAIAAYLVTAPTASSGDDGAAAQAAIDRASARTLTDLAHARQSILDAIAEIDAKTP
jgi:hypothetical protein